MEKEILHVEIDNGELKIIEASGTILGMAKCIAFLILTSARSVKMELDYILKQIQYLVSNNKNTFDKLSENIKYEN